MDEDGKASYLAIAKRAQTEAVNLYTVLVLGAEMYRLGQKLKNTGGRVGGGNPGNG